MLFCRSSGSHGSLYLGKSTKYEGQYGFKEGSFTDDAYRGYCDSQIYSRQSIDWEIRFPSIASDDVDISWSSEGELKFCVPSRSWLGKGNSCVASPSQAFFCLMQLTLSTEIYQWSYMQKIP